MHFHKCKQQQVICINEFLEDGRFTEYTVINTWMWNLVSSHRYMLLYDVLPLRGNLLVLRSSLGLKKKNGLIEPCQLALSFTFILAPMRYTALDEI
jgi:hypothetical protein